jgi:hypothetical protein
VRVHWRCFEAWLTWYLAASFSSGDTARVRLNASGNNVEVLDNHEPEQNEGPSRGGAPRELEIADEE